MNNRTALVAATSLIALGLTGCTIGGSAEPESTGDSAPTSTAADEAFAIEKPKDLKTVPDPCQLLTTEQLDELGGLGAATPEPTQSEWNQAACEWSNGALSLKVSPDTVQRGGIEYASKIYGENDTPTTDVNGYPALNTFENDLRCGTVVGTNAEELILASFTVGTDGRDNPEYQDPCAMSDKIAGMVIDNLPPA